MAMVKADAYGHGMVECAKIFTECGAAAFGVAEVVEGVALRRAGISNAVFVLAGILPEFFDALLTYQLTPVLVDGTLISPLAREAVRRGITLGVHLKVDAGMGRQGCLLRDIPEIISAIARSPGIILEGIMAHFPQADDPHSGNSERVLDDFLTLVRVNRDALPPSLCLHIANSGGLFSVRGAGLHMVRPGISLYGYAAAGRKALDAGGEQDLIPAMRFVSRVIQVREVPAGTGLGYGHTYTTAARTRLAILPLGYEDGFLRSLSNTGQVLLRGQRAPVVGRISMNLTLVDVTGIQGIQVGDEAVLLGCQGRDGITADELGEWMETISYEVLCLFGHCNRIVYID